MKITIRKESINEPVLLNMLINTATIIINNLNDNNIKLSDTSLKIWVKAYGSQKYFPKIEIDSNDQELQYDLNTEGQITETHFKIFTHTGQKHKRQDIEKEKADILLRKIDDIVKTCIPQKQGD